MGPVAFALLSLCAAALMAAPRRWAALPFLAGGTYLPVGLTLELGPFNFYPLRLLIAVGFIRVLLRQERALNGFVGLDWAIVVWAAVAVITGVFHEDASAALVSRVGLVYTVCGLYFLLRIFCGSSDGVVQLLRVGTIVLMPVAVAMLVENATGQNLLALAGGVPAMSEVRSGQVRSQGPFAHSILAGTVGAVALPLAVALWPHHRRASIGGVAASLAMVFSSSSSGPLMSLAFAIAALLMWPARRHTRLLRWGVVLGYLVLDVVMNAPAYYVLAYIDLTGSSTSWHRAFLIETALAHWSEWWLIGTDHTRHWMPYGVPWSANHVDITNHYLRMGVDGGMPLLLTFMAVLAVGFAHVGRAGRVRGDESPARRVFVWAVGASLFAHAAAFISVSYFDQSVIFLYLTLAVIGSMPSVGACAPRRSEAAAALPGVSLQRGLHA